MTRKIVETVIRTILKVIGLAVGVLSSAVLYQFFGLRFVMDGGGTPYPRFVQTNEWQAERIERHREAQRATAGADTARTCRAAAGRRRAGGIAPGAPEPAAAPKTDAAPPSWTGPVLDGLPRPEARRRVSRGAGACRLADGGTDAALEAAGRRGIRLVRCGSRARIHDRAARRTGGGGRVRRAHGPRALDQFVGRRVPRVDGRRRPEGDAHVV